MDVSIHLMKKLVVLGTIAIVFFGIGLLFSMSGLAADKTPKKAKLVYPKKSEVDFEGMRIQGELKNPGEFYFQRRPEEKFDSLVKRRKNFHREMLRDVVMTK